MKKIGRVFFRDTYAGKIEQADGAYQFTYDPEYLDRVDSHPISLTLPLRRDPYVEKTMIPFFDGLIPEGWLLNLAVKNWKIDRRDRMTLLLTLCEDCIGAVKIVNVSEEN
ncbi:MAG: hypothetical protein C5B49_00795 [Bdellovibrio sp.]|nr:MAG: hypothetical protein C5B49_00795 [Bdellovibrio sp.]